MLGAAYNLLILSLFTPVFSSENWPRAAISQSAIQEQCHNFSIIEKQHDCTNNPLIEDSKRMKKKLYSHLQQELQVLAP